MTTYPALTGSSGRDHQTDRERFSHDFCLAFCMICEKVELDSTIMIVKCLYFSFNDIGSFKCLKFSFFSAVSCQFYGFQRVYWVYRKNPKVSDTRKFIVIILKVEQDGVS